MTRKTQTTEQNYQKSDATDTNCHSLVRALATIALAGVAMLASSPAALAGGDVTFHEIADDPGSGLFYERAKSASFADFDAFRQASLVSPLPFEALFDMPYNTLGQPGVAIFDYDNDGDDDIYVTNGPGAPNSLFSNQLVESGSVTFDDVGIDAGVDAVDQDGMGACAGDIDNDGDTDLLVLGRDQPNRLFENQGDGTFIEIMNSGLEGGYLGHSSCAMGDVDGDGLLDVAVANSYSHEDLVACFVQVYDASQPNQLYLNQGGSSFVDVSDTSGIRVLEAVPAGKPTITWAVAMLDVDTDGDTDLVFADDQCGLLSAFNGGVDRGYLHIMINDGTGHFSDSAVNVTGGGNGNWMSLSAGDLNCDGNVDLFGSNFGDYDNVNVGVPYQLGLLATRWFLGNGDGTYSDPGVGDTISSVFGWGSSMIDYDNDGDLDITYYGGLDGNYLIHVDSSRGILLENENCSADFERDLDSLPVNPLRGPVQALATADLDRNGFPDIVNASSYDLPPSTTFIQSPAQYGSDFDSDALFVAAFEFINGGFVWSGIEFDPGSLSVILNSGDNGNKWARVRTLGTVDITTLGSSNRDGIGATVSFTALGGDTVTMPVLGGGSYSSQHSLELLFGLGSANKGMVEVLWPGGVRNRLYNVHKFESLVLPEIPCSFDADWPSFNAYKTCVKTSLNELESAGVIDNATRARLFVSAILAFLFP